MAMNKTWIIPKTVDESNKVFWVETIKKLKPYSHQTDEKRLQHDPLEDTASIAESGEICSMAMPYNWRLKQICICSLFA